MIRERCGCGAEFEVDEEDSLEIWTTWREIHRCVVVVEESGGMGGVAQVEQAPDYTIPELHVGFRPSWD